jgi:hypothetical protein
MDILPIQASAVPCERVFSSAKETITPRRNRITPELMEALQILKYSLRHKESLNFTAGLREEEEAIELERLNDTLNETSENLREFREALGHRNHTS